MKLTMILFLIFFCAGFVFSQNAGSSDIDNIQGLLLDRTTPDEAVGILGAPEKIKIDKLKIQKLDDWFAQKRDEKIFKILSFEKVKGFASIELSFWDDKLVLIHYNLNKRFPARDLPRIYQTMFVPIISETVSFQPSDYQDLKGNIEVVNYPHIYYLVSVSPAGIISARVSYESASTDQTRRAPRLDLSKKAKRPLGKVTDIEIISRKLEKG